MITITTLCQFVIALGILNVWVIRFNRATPWRGGEATTMRQEFAVYGLPAWSCILVGFLKITAAAALLLGMWVPEVIKPAAFVVAVLMLAAVVMHLRVSDPLRKSLPAFIMFLLSSWVLFLAA